jgi:hypothetical protein
MLVAALVAAMTITVSYGAARTPVKLPSATASVTHAAAPKVLDASREACPDGMILEHAGGGGGIPECKIAGGPEAPGEQMAAEKGRGAIYNAGSGITGPGVYADAVRQRNSLPITADPQSARPWAPVGVPPLLANQQYNIVTPVNRYIDALGFKKLSGRITDLARDPATPGRMFASAAEGGVWESRDAGQNWYSIGDNLITQSVGAIAWDPLAPAGTDTGTLIVGTGDNAQGRYNYSGHGIFITQDDGRTWTAASTQVADPSQNFRIRISPNDPHRVYAATSKGLYRGVFQNNLSNIDFVNVALPTSPPGYPVDCAGDTTSFPACFLASNVTDVVVRAPGGHQPVGIAPQLSSPGDEVLANVGARFGPALYLKPDGTGTNGLGLKQVPQAGLYHSTTGDPGSFSYIDDSGSCLIIFEDCYPGSDHVGRVSLDSAIGPDQDHSIVYALVHDPIKETACFDDFGVPISICQGAFHDPVLGLPTPAGNLSTVLDGMYYSNNFGAAGSWTKVMDWGQLDVQGTNSAIGGVGGQAPVGYGPGIQSSYNNWVLIDPVGADSNGVPDRLLFGLEEIWEANPNFVCEGDQKTSNWLLLQKHCEVPLVNVPWIVVGRYWNACGPFTFGQGLTCNSTSITPGSTTHPDQHAAMFVPDADGENFYAGSDGGMFLQRSDAAHPQFDNDSWGDGISNNMNVLQPYNAEISKDGTVVAGLQDNGEILVKPDSGEMVEIYGGDGTMSGIDPDNSQNIMECYVYAICNVTHDGGIHWSRIDAAITQPRFDAPLQMDPTDAKHYLTGGREVKERVDGYSPSPDCIPSNPVDFTCFLDNNAEWRQVYNLGTSKQPGQANAASSAGDGNNSSSAVDVSDANMYVGFCAQCDTFLEGVPFTNGIATNVGGVAPPVKGSTSWYDSNAFELSWHLATMNCGNCRNTDGSPMNRLPQRYISSIRMDPADVNTIYVTLGGYHRVWVPPLAFGEDNPYVGQGHVFKSTDHGENFTDISGNMPNTPALWSVIHNGQLVVATDIGVFISGNTDGGSYSVLGSQLPAAPVDTIRISPGNPDLLIAATWGRGIYSYCFAGATCPSDTFVPPVELPNTARAGFLVAWLLLPLTILAGALALARRRRQQEVAV